MALNCCVVPIAIEAFAGVTAIDTNTGGVTVRVVELATPLSVAVIRDVPAVAPVATPEADMGATFGWLELHTTEGVRFCVLPFWKWPVARNCCVLPEISEGFAGVTLIEVRPVSLPVPPRAITLGLPKALSLIVSVPCINPTAVGAKVTPTVQLDPAPRFDPQVLLATAKSLPVAIEENNNVVLR